MEPNQVINLKVPHRIDVNSSPTSCDVAITSINEVGSEGILNVLTVKAYGYTSKDLPTQKDLTGGFFYLKKENKKGILFIVTIGEKSTGEMLRANLTRGLKEMHRQLQGSIWLPLLGTGEGRLKLEESYEIIREVLNSVSELFSGGSTFCISLPDGRYEKNFLEGYGGYYGSENSEEVKAVESPITKFKGSYYLVGSMWGNADQSESFISKGEWINAKEEMYDDLVNAVKEYDILFLKSTYAMQNTSILRIKAVGRVVANPKNGSDLKVEWKMPKMLLDIADLGKYRNTIMPVAGEDLEEILTLIGKVRLLQSGIYDPPPPRITNIAGLIADSTSGEDHLQLFEKDVEAFARIMASKKFIPPLAIALFGKWGSGKSFFMGKLRERIEYHANSKKAETFCEGVAQIHFNAWSYLDANLWASLVTRIFDGLYAYIKNDKSSDQQKEEIKKELSGQLTVAKEGVAILENQKKSIEAQIESLETQKQNLEKELMAGVEAIEKNTLKEFLNKADVKFEAKEKVIATIQNNPTYQITEAQLKEIVPAAYWNKPDEAYNKVKSAYTFFREFIRPDKIGRNLTWLTIILLVIFLSPIIIKLTVIKLAGFNFMIPQVGISLLVALGAAWRRAEKVYKELHPLIAGFWQVKVEHEKAIEEAKSQFEQNEKALKLKIEKNKSELVGIVQQIQQSKAVEADLNFRINNALATEALYSFIEKRTGSDEYKKHLGIVSIIRKDLEILSSLFTEHNTEKKLTDEEAEKRKQFQQKFARPLQRIILYIDDLDRCPEDRVVEVLEAVNLLMAYPLFVVVVGVDPRWIKNALMRKHQLQFAALPNGNKLDGLEQIEASNYLEKIFQVPFHLKEAQDDAVKKMISKLVTVTSTQTATNQQATEEYNNSQLPENVVNEVPVNNLQQNNEDKRKEEISKASNPLQSIEALLQQLVLSEREVQLMQNFAPLIGNNPRAIKRFVNTYHIIRAHQELTLAVADENDDELLSIMFLLALSCGPFKRLYRPYKSFITKNQQLNTYIGKFFESPLASKGMDFTTEETLILADKYKCSETITRNNQVIANFLTLQPATAAKHMELVERFTFEEM